MDINSFSIFLKGRFSIF